MGQCVEDGRHPRESVVAGAVNRSPALVFEIAELEFGDFDEIVGVPLIVWG